MRRFRPYFRYLKPHRALLVFALLCGIIYGAANGAGLPLMTKTVFPVIFRPHPTDVPENWQIANLIKKLDLTPAQVQRLQPAYDAAARDFKANRENGDAISRRLDRALTAELTPQQLENHKPRTFTAAELVLIALWLPAIFLVRGVAGYLNSYFIQLIGTRVLEAIRLDLFRKFQFLPLSFFHKNATGDLLSRGLADANQLQVTLTNAANEIVKSPATLLGALGYLGWLAYHTHGLVLVLVSLGVIPLCVLPIRYVGKKLIARASQIQAEFGAVTNRMAENLSAAREVRAFNLEQREIDRFAQVSRTLIRVQMKYVKYDKMLTPLIEIISACGISLTFVYAYKVQLDITTFLSLITALYVSYEPIKKLGALNNDFKRGLGALDRLEEVLHEPESIADAPDARALERARGALEFENVEFAYVPGLPVLRHVSTVIEPGTVCALVGPSGAGKSTFANLVPRFFDVTDGRVLLDRHDLRSLRMADLRRNIAIVSQEPVLFNDTVFNNLLLGRPDASRSEVEQAAKDAFAHDFIVNLDGGLAYDTVVGERGSRLSGGQKQRIAIARAFLRQAPILILDEATSALDSDSEAAIQAALKKLVIGKTVLIIAHRFSTIRDATKILVFDRGEVVATGTHAELYVANALYRSLYDRQQGGVLTPA
ncbi:MAG TPA: ABC transporter ATP-binding protein [Opitutaceae bacterium]|nr:ABC transporter ATP-binding protein [Opitutaceae bacterium]